MSCVYVLVESLQPVPTRPLARLASLAQDSATTFFTTMSTTSPPVAFPPDTRPVNAMSSGLSTTPDHVPFLRRTTRSTKLGLRRQ